MKKIFTLMLAFACAMFVGVSCAPDQGEEDKRPAALTLTPGSLEVGPEEGGAIVEYKFNVTGSITDQLTIESDVAWLTAELSDEGQTVTVSYTANDENPGSEPRVGTLSFLYGANDPVLFTVKQASAEPVFTAEFSDVTCNSAKCVCTPADTTMAYLFVTTAELSMYGVQGETAAEKVKNFLGMILQYGMLNEDNLYSYWYKGLLPEGLYKDVFRRSADDVVEVYAMGFTVTGEAAEMVATPCTPVHTFVPPFLPYPEVSVSSLEKTVSSAAGELVLDVTIKNPIEDAELSIECDAAWLKSAYADGKLTLTYDANVYAISRTATISISYDAYISPIKVVVTQEKDGSVEPITFNITVKETHFNCIIVDVDCSDDNATYVLGKTPNKEGAEVDWSEKVDDEMGYQHGLTFLKGDVTGHVIKMNPTNYKSYGYNYYVYAYAVVMDEAGTSAIGAISEVTSVTTTVDASDQPTLTWAVENGVVIEDGNYRLYANPGDKITVKYVLEKPVEGGSVVFNGNVYDNYNVIEETAPVIDLVNNTVSFTISPYDASKKYHYCNLSIKYTNANGDNWGAIAPTLRVYQNTMIVPSILSKIIQESTYKLADGTEQDVTNEATWAKWSLDNYNFSACRVLINGTSDSKYYGLLQFQGDASTVAKQGFLGNTTEIKGMKKVVIEAYSTYDTPSFNVYYGTTKLPNDATKKLAVESNCVKGASVGMEGNYECFSFTCTFEIPEGNTYFALRNDTRGAAYIKSISIIK